MNIRKAFPPSILSILILSLFCFPVSGQNESAGDTKKILTKKDLGKWERLGYSDSELSEDGNWLIYSIYRNNKENELRLHNIAKNTQKVLKGAENYKFSGDSKWLGYRAPKDSKDNNEYEFNLLNLQSGKTNALEDVSSFSFSSDGRFLALKQYPDENAVVNLIVKNLSSGVDKIFNNVDEYEWSKNGSLLAITLSTENEKGNGILLYDGKNSVKVDSEKETYSQLTWRDNSKDLAVLRSRSADGYAQATNDILVWKNLSMKKDSAKTFNPLKVDAFPKDMRLLGNKGLRWSRDGESIFFNIDKWEKSEEEGADDDEEQPEIPSLEIWNSSDVRTIPEQKQNADDNSNLAVWHIGAKKFVTIGSTQANDVKYQNDSDVLLALDETPYKFKAMFGRPSSDIFAVDIKTGERKKLLDNIIYVESISPGGKSFVYIKDDNYHLYDLAKGESLNITKDLDASFVNLDDDHPVEQKPPYGFAGWDKDGSYFVLYSKFDIWKFDANTGAATRLTNGKPQEVLSRLQHSKSPNGYLDLSQPVYIYRFGRRSKKSGYAKLLPDGSIKDIYWDDAMVSRLALAKDKDIAVFSIEKYNDSPDFFVSREGSSDIRQVSKTNPFENEYKIGKSELIEYENANGKKLQGILYYPDNYEASKKYPMITYIYEMLSDDLHAYSVPAETNYYSTRIFTSRGYFVLKPDIVFDAGDPGVSSTKTLEIAVKTVVDRGLVDEKKVGLIGHSWGGYQTAFAVTRTNVFAAAVAGAGITNLITMYGSITPSFGNTFESRHFEVNQERMRVPPWEDINGYLRNSAIPNIKNMQTPLLMEVGDSDTNVSWRQSIEMYNAARRAKKEIVLLVYEGEGHGLRQDRNRADYQKRILEWFGHYLKDEPAKRWITDNISYSEQQKLLEERKLE